MAHAPGNGADRLDSWKAIAVYLHRDERTVRRWERQLGLPIRRVPGGRGTSVFAYTSEIEAWLKATPPPASPPRVMRPAWRVPTVVLGCGLLAVGVVWRVVADSTAYAPPVRVEVTASGLVARDAVDAEQWRYAFPTEERVFLLDHRPTAVVDGGSPAVFAATAFRLRRADDAVQGVVSQSG
ncbi:MAG: hypothetical protein HY657_15315 [Acidobacteria bacterium]|nr:hypothetical protein [Acidobacteriota bacterium]